MWGELARRVRPWQSVTGCSRRCGYHVCGRLGLNKDATRRAESSESRGRSGSDEALQNVSVLLYSFVLVRGHCAGRAFLSSA